MFPYLELPDLCEANKIGKPVFICEAPSVYCHSDWTEEEQTKAGAFTTSSGSMIFLYYQKGPSNRLVVNTDIFDFTP